MIEVIKLSHAFQSRTTVDKVSFTVKEGCVMGLIGPKGAGKTTLIKMLTALLPPTSGTAKILGHDLMQNPAQIRQNIGYYPQLHSADRKLSGFENLLNSARIYGIPFQEQEYRINELMDFMDLTEFADQTVNYYSEEMTRRLEIAQAIIHQPKILFLDEPTLGLDFVEHKCLMQVVEDLNKVYGMTILLATHDLEEVDHLCQIVAVMNLGQIVAMDSPAKLKANFGPDATMDDVFSYYTGLQKSVLS